MLVDALPFERQMIGSAGVPIILARSRLAAAWRLRQRPGLAPLPDDLADARSAPLRT
jgi:hypothetical protein